ncbi:MAG: imidazole glycerol phosphate synthase subunit HisH [Candidatus Margulisbacteria bacterium]|nr:imidazole glycerol phosphate synthase subunit HisH [Candidatus Margulisiibacteriota bacterium]
MIGIIDYGMGNIRSVLNAVEMVGGKADICTDPNTLSNYEQLILPGVGAFPMGIKNLQNRGFVEPLTKRVIVDKIPILGICLGMQLMAARGTEGVNCDGLNWIDATVEIINKSNQNLKIPHVGWNDIEYNPGCSLFRQLPPHPDMYFVHSYHMVCKNPSIRIAQCQYKNATISAAIQNNTIWGTQFHPEKSQEFGLKILENFLLE